MDEENGNNDWLVSSIGTLSVDEEYKFDEEFNNKDENMRKLEILVLGPIFTSFLNYITANDIIQFLSICTFLLNNSTCWDIVVKKLDLKAADIQLVPSAKKCTPRKLTLFTINQLGFSCQQCLNILDGTNGLFAVSSLCKNCSTSKFKGTECVEGTIRFYLSGMDSITIKGHAFLTYPFFVNVDDDVKTRIDNLCGSAFQVALSIYEEKMFFRKFAPKDIKRARDDKNKTIRQMIDIHEDRRTSKVLLSFSFSRKEEKVDEEPSWIKELPNSLLGIYNSELSKKQSGGNSHTPTLTHTYKHKHNTNLALLIINRNKLFASRSFAFKRSSENNVRKR